MSTAISIRFLSGRFHATPWGRHVNEDAPEWPPAPWRILRALVAAWKGCGDRLVADGVMASVLKKLAAPPSYALPPASVGHSRHYMPLFSGDRTMVFDKFVVVDREERLVVVWPDVNLNEAEAMALDRVLPRLSYLGRAESWCEVVRADMPSLIKCKPIYRSDALKGERIRLLGPRAGAPRWVMDSGFDLQSRCKVRLPWATFPRSYDRGPIEAGCLSVTAR